MGQNEPSPEELLRLVWRLFDTAIAADKPDHPSCAKYAELLFKMMDKRPKKAPDDYETRMAAIAALRQEGRST